tara:strand:+ start:592 stop:1041 length:450 start_codon:yes stop_codon:yes gene_type:complete
MGRAAMTRDRCCSGFHNPAVGVTQTSPKQWKNGDMPPLTSPPDGLKSLAWIPLIHRLTQLTLKSDALSAAHRWLEQGQIRAFSSSPQLDPGVHLRRRGLHQAQLSPVNGRHGCRICASQQGFSRPAPQAPEHSHQHEGGTTGKELIHRV